MSRTIPLRAWRARCTPGFSSASEGRNYYRSPREYAATSTLGPRLESLSDCFDAVLEAGGNPRLMSTKLKTTLAEHTAGSYRVVMNTADELLAAAAECNVDRLDGKLLFDIFPASIDKKGAAEGRKLPLSQRSPPRLSASAGFSLPTHQS